MLVHRYLFRSALLFLFRNCNTTTLANTTHARQNADNLLISRLWLQETVIQLCQDIRISSVVPCYLPRDSPRLLCWKHCIISTSKTWIRCSTVTYVEIVEVRGGGSAVGSHCTGCCCARPLVSHSVGNMSLDSCCRSRHVEGLP
jgi:hypothetical protein